MGEACRSVGAVWQSDPARMVRTEIVDPASDEARVFAVCVDDPDRGCSTSFRTTKCDVLTVWGFTRAEIPEWRVALCQGCDSPVTRVEPADLGAASG